MTKIVTYQDGMLHILRNPHGFTEDVVREARLRAADRIEALIRQTDALVAALTRCAEHPGPVGDIAAEAIAAHQAAGFFAGREPHREGD